MFQQGGADRVARLRVAEAAVVALETLRHPGLQGLRLGIPGRQREQHRNGAALLAYGRQGEQQADQQHGLPGARSAQDHEALRRHALQEHLGDLPARSGQFVRPVGPAGPRSRPVRGQLPQQRPRFAEPCVGRPPGDRQRIGVVQAPHPGLGLPLLPHRRGQPVRDAGQVPGLAAIGAQRRPRQIHAAHRRQQRGHRLGDPQVETDGETHRPDHAADREHEIDRTDPPSLPTSPHGRIFGAGKHPMRDIEGSAPRMSDSDE